MFRIGEFALIAQVTGRLLRYYDRIGLLRPAHSDPATGYRYYSAAQLPRLNRILALKDLGLTLEQIAGLVDEPVATDRLRDMLLARKAQAEQSLAAEQARLRHIESRIRQIDDGAAAGYDVVVKSVPAQPWLSLRGVYDDIAEALDLLGRVVRIVPSRLKGGWERLTVLGHTGFDDDRLDLEAGFTLPRPLAKPPALPDGLAMRPGELPAVPTMATVVRRGPADESHLAFGSLGHWMETNGYRAAGPCREVFLELPAGDHTVVEIQFPVARAGP